MSRDALALVLVAALGSSACTDRGETESAGGDEPRGSELGEIMTFTQMRHAKLFVAGENENWDLSAYELKELGEGFEAAVRAHPEHEGEPIGELLSAHMNGPLEALGAAVEAHDRKAFEAAFDRLTAACNACHERVHFGFNRVVRPAAPPVTNQDFAPLARP